MVVDLVVPEESLVSVTPLVVLGTDVLVRVLGALLQRRHVRPVLPVLAPEPVGVGTGGDKAGGDTVEGDLLPEFSGTSSVLLDVLALLDELVLCAGKSALGGSAKLGGSARGSAGESDGGHRGCCCSL